MIKTPRYIALALVLVLGVYSEKDYPTAPFGRRALQVWTSRLSPRVLVANDPGLYSLLGLSRALESLLLQVDYTTDITAAGGLITRSNYDVVIFPKILSTTDFSNLYRILVTFLYDGGAVVLGPSPFDINITATFTQNMVSQTSFYGDTGVAVTIECEYAPVPIYMASNQSANWNLSTMSIPDSWPDLLGAGAVSYNPSSYPANCGPLTDPVGGAVMYRDMSGMGTTTVFSLPRGQGRFYYMGLDFDNDPRDGSWGKLLTSIAEQAVSNPPSVNGASSPPVASPPPSSVAAAPEESELYNTSLENVTGTIFWPVGRGRVSYTAAGLTASSALTSPPSPAAPRASYLCHDLLVNGSGAAAANGSSTSASGGGAWVVIDLGTRRRVTAVRIQALEAGYDASIAIQGVAVGLEVRVGPTPANAATEPAYVNDPLCPALEPVIVIGASVVSGTAAVDVSCGAKNTLVSSCRFSCKCCYRKMSMPARAGGSLCERAAAQRHPWRHLGAAMRRGGGWLAASLLRPRIP
ncbi:hypothetical protein Vafri_2391 [Volvox africanus]|nr:hypothetical protein Vafri_2391 [Volvox africanus]